MRIRTDGVCQSSRKYSNWGEGGSERRCRETVDEWMNSKIERTTTEDRRRESSLESRFTGARLEIVAILGCGHWQGRAKFTGRRKDEKNIRAVPERSLRS